jgi:hypothetical protein
MGRRPGEGPTAHGAIAQLGERLDRTQEVGGSSPPSSTEELPAPAAFSPQRDASYPTGGKGKNSYAVGAGNDSITARNKKRETVDSGAGKKDNATVDKNEKVKRSKK